MSAEDKDRERLQAKADAYDELVQTAERKLANMTSVLKLCKSALYPWVEYEECDCDETRGIRLTEKCDWCFSKEAYDLATLELAKGA